MTRNFGSFIVIATISFSCFLANCNSSTKEKSKDQNKDSIILADALSAPNDIFGINGNDIAIRKGPGKTFEKVINLKTTEIMHKTVYATVDHTVKIWEDETKDGWSKIVVVEPDYLSESHQGWIETKFIDKENKPKEESNSLRKVGAFNDVRALQKALGKNGIGLLRNWHNDGSSWISSTGYFSFGSNPSEYGLQNNLAYYLESDNQATVNTVELVLNVNNRSEKTQAISLFDKTAKKTFTSINLEVPKGLSNSIRSENNFNLSSSVFKVSLSLIESNIDTWRLTIETK